MKKVIRLTESDLIRIVKRVIKEESESYTLDDYLLVLGYLHKHGDQMYKDSGENIYFLQSKKLRDEENVLLFSDNVYFCLFRLHPPIKPID